MNPSVLLDKILQLEKEILELKSQCLPPKNRLQRVYQRTKNAVDGILSYWILLALIIGLLVNWWFGVGFFENIKNIGINKTSSDYYYRIGNVLMSHAEFKAASEAFAKSLEINPYNIDSTHGLMKTQVFQAIGDNQEFNPIVVEDKLTYLRKIFGEDDYVLLYWEGILRRQQSASPDDLKIPELLFQRSIDKNAEFLGSYFELGKTYLLGGEVDKAAEKFKQVVDLDSRSTDALNNLGYCWLITANFESERKNRKAALAKASDYLEQAHRTGNRPETDLHLGDAYLYLGQYQSAKISHENALGTLEKLDSTKQYTPFGVMFVYLPETTRDARDRGPAITLSTKEELKMVALYSLSLDHASLGDFKTADKYFGDAGSLDPRKLFNPLIANKIYSFYNLPGSKANLNPWLKIKIEALCQGREGCKPEMLVKKG
jgi:tetratricopeptide (TPR) repeat protein